MTSEHGYPINSTEQLVGERREQAAPVVTEIWRTFEITDFRVALLYRGQTVKRYGTWTAQGQEDAIAEGLRVAKNLGLHPDDNLETVVVRRTFHVDRRLSGQGRTYRERRGEAPTLQDLYDRARNSKLISAMIVWSWHPKNGSERELTESQLTDPLLTSDG